MRKTAPHRHRGRSPAERKRARRVARLEAETPGQREARELRLMRTVEEGERKLLGGIPPVPVSPTKPDPDPLVAVECDCDPPRKHGPHWRPERLVAAP